MMTAGSTPKATCLLYNKDMEREYWLRQEPDKPLFPELEWSRPENRQHAGKLLVVGGNAFGFAAPAEAYAESEKAGAGATRVLLPDAVKKVVGSVLQNGEFAPSTPGSGSFSQKALNELLLAANWADAVLIAGDLGRNSETAILLEKFLSKHPGAVTLTKDAVDYITANPRPALNRPNTLLVLSLSQLQRLAIAAKSPQPVTFGMDLLHLAEWLHEFTKTNSVQIIVKHHDQICVAMDGQISTTRTPADLPIWRLKIAAHASVWGMQNPAARFKAYTAAVQNAIKTKR